MKFWQRSSDLQKEQNEGRHRICQKREGRLSWRVGVTGQGAAISVSSTAWGESLAFSWRSLGANQNITRSQFKHWENESFMFGSKNMHLESDMLGYIFFLLTRCVILGPSLYLSNPQFPQKSSAQLGVQNTGSGHRLNSTTPKCWLYDWESLSTSLSFFILMG